MTSIRRALGEVERHVAFTSQYLVEHYDNLRLEAKHGLSDNPDWILSPEAEHEFQRWRQGLVEAWRRLRGTLENLNGPAEARSHIKRARRKLRKAENVGPPDPNYLDFEVLETVREVLAGKRYVPKSYSKWNRPKFNRWYHTPYISDLEALHGKVFWLNPSTRFVLFEARAEVRWRAGRVLLSLPYREVEKIESEWRRGREYLCCILRSGVTECVDLSRTTDSGIILSELQGRIDSVQRGSGGISTD